MDWNALLNNSLAKAETDKEVEPASQSSSYFESFGSSSHCPIVGNSPEEGWITNDKNPKVPPPSKNRPETFKTVARAVDMWRLVWAKNYLHKNCYFCARVCDNYELFGQPGAQPASDEIGVEVFNMERGRDTKLHRFLIVKEKDLLSYYGTKRDMNQPIDNRSAFAEPNNQTDRNSWSMRRMDLMRKALDRYPSRVTKELFDEIEHTANEFLRLSQEDLIRKASSQSSESITITSESYEPTEPVESVPKFDIRSLAPDRHAKKETLAVGDWIAFNHKLFKNQILYTKITAFTGDAQKPLELANMETVRVTDNIQKCYTRETYIPKSGDCNSEPRHESDLVLREAETVLVFFVANVMRRPRGGPFRQLSEYILLNGEETQQARVPPLQQQQQKQEQKQEKEHAMTVDLTDTRVTPSKKRRLTPTKTAATSSDVDSADGSSMGSNSRKRSATAFQNKASTTGAPKFTSSVPVGGWNAALDAAVNKDNQPATVSTGSRSSNRKRGIAAGSEDYSSVVAETVATVSAVEQNNGNVSGSGSACDSFDLELSQTPSTSSSVVESNSGFSFLSPTADKSSTTDRVICSNDNSNSSSSSARRSSRIVLSQDSSESLVEDRDTFPVAQAIDISSSSSMVLESALNRDFKRSPRITMSAKPLSVCGSDSGTVIGSVKRTPVLSAAFLSPSLSSTVGEQQPSRLSRSQQKSAAVSASSAASDMFGSALSTTFSTTDNEDDHDPPHGIPYGIKSNTKVTETLSMFADSTKSTAFSDSNDEGGDDDDSMVDVVEPSNSSTRNVTKRKRGASAVSSSGGRQTLIDNEVNSRSAGGGGGGGGGGCGGVVDLTDTQPELNVTPRSADDRNAAASGSSSSSNNRRRPTRSRGQVQAQLVEEVADYFVDSPQKVQR